MFRFKARGSLNSPLTLDNYIFFNVFLNIFRLLSNDSIQIRFVTNTTKESKETLLNRLHRIGFFFIKKADIFSSLSAAVEYVKKNQLKPFYLLTEDAKRDFMEQTEGMTTTNDIDGTENSVVVGLAPDQFAYEQINKAFWYDFFYFKLFLNQFQIEMIGFK